jgi:hypothetical protein
VRLCRICGGIAEINGACNDRTHTKYMNVKRDYSTFPPTIIRTKESIQEDIKRLGWAEIVIRFYPKTNEIRAIDTFNRYKTEYEILKSKGEIA